MTTSSFYFVIRVDIEHPEEISTEDVLDEVQSEMDYNLSYDSNNIKIVSIEICGTQNNE